MSGGLRPHEAPGGVDDQAARPRAGKADPAREGTRGSRKEKEGAGRTQAGTRTVRNMVQYKFHLFESGSWGA